MPSRSMPDDGTHPSLQRGVNRQSLGRTVGLVLLAIVTLFASWLILSPAPAQAKSYNVTPPYYRTGLSIADWYERPVHFYFEVGAGDRIEVAAEAAAKAWDSWDKQIRIDLYKPNSRLSSVEEDGTMPGQIASLEYTADVAGTYDLQVDYYHPLSNSPDFPIEYSLSIEVTRKSITTTTSAPTTTTTAPGLSTFSDVPASHPYAVQIEDLAARGIVGGYANGTFQPDAYVTRQQFAKMVVLTCGYPVSESDVCAFTDVQKSGTGSLYPDNYVAVCAAYGITTGKTSTHFAPQDNMRRAQLITMVARAASLSEPPAGYSPPFGKFSADHYPWARKAYYAGILDGLLGIDSGGYGFWANATRGEVCVLLYNLLHR